MQERLSGYEAELCELLTAADFLCLLVVDSTGMVAAANQSARRLLGGDVAGPAPVGTQFDELLQPQSRQILAGAGGDGVLNLKLGFLSMNRNVVPMSCQLVWLADGTLLLLGGQLMLGEDEVLRKMSLMTNEMVNMTRELQRKNRELQEAQAKIKVLSGIIPICMHCKGIRDDKGYWNKLEAYITQHSEALFSHSICDACLEKHYPDLDLG